MSWNRTGEEVVGHYCGETFSGTVTDSRVKYSGTVQHTVELDQPIVVYGSERNEVLVGNGDLT